MLRFTLHVSSPIPGQRLGTALLGATMFWLGSAVVTMAASHPGFSTPEFSGSQESTVVAQLFKRTPSNGSSINSPTGCGPQGCRLSIDQMLLRNGDIFRATYNGNDRQIIQTGETRKLVLNLNEPLRSRGGQVVVPANSEIEGEIVPIEGGGQFVANRILVNGRAYSFQAQSGTIHDIKDPNQTDAGAIAGDAGIGVAGGIVLGQILGQRGITIEQVLGGAVAGVVIGNVTAPRAVVINKGDQVELKMSSDFRL